MTNSLIQPYVGPLSLDLQDLNGALVDVVPGATRGLRREKPGIETVLGELETNIPVQASTLGVAPDIFERITKHTDNLAKIRAARVVIDKLAEILEESEIYIEDEREGDIGTVVKAARDASRRKDPAVLASFERTIEYHGQIGARAQATRRKNAAAKEGPSDSAQSPSPAPSPPE